MKKYLIKEMYNEYNDIYYDSLVDDIENNFNSEIFIGFNNEYNGINYKIIYDIYNDILNYSNYYVESYYKNNIFNYFIDALRHIKRISLKQAIKIKKIVDSFNNNDMDKYDAITNILTVVYCKEYKHTLMRGISQSDWIYCFYASDINYSFIQYIEAVLFNTGVEIYISSEKKDVSVMDEYIDNDIEYDGYHDYIVDYFLDSDKLKTVADIIGCNVDEIEYYNIDNVRVITTHKVEYKKINNEVK